MNTPTAFVAHGKTWYPHIPGEPMPCPADAKVEALMCMELNHPQGYTPCVVSGHAWDWSPIPEDPNCEIIGWRYADEQAAEKDEATVKGEQVTHALGVAMMELATLREIITACLAEMPCGNIATHTPENLPARIKELAQVLAEKSLEVETIKDDLEYLAKKAHA